MIPLPINLNFNPETDHYLKSKLLLFQLEIHIISYFDILFCVQLTLGKVNILTNTFIIAWIVLEYTLCFSKWVIHNIIYKYIKKYILPVYEELCCPAGF